jgi:thiamine kinase-like enzyme
VGLDENIVQAVMAAVGPVGVGILAAVWLLTRKKENGSQNIRRSQVLETLTKIDSDVGHLRDVTEEIKEDVRELRQSYTQHLQDHSTQ